MEEALHAEVADAETQHGELVQLGHHVGREGQQAGQVVQLGVEPVAVPLGGVRPLSPRGGLPAGNQRSQTGRLHRRPRPRRWTPVPGPPPAAAPQERSASEWSCPRTDLARSRWRTRRGRHPVCESPLLGEGRRRRTVAGGGRGLAVRRRPRSLRHPSPHARTRARTQTQTRARTHAHAHGLLRPAALPQVRAEQPLGPRFPPQRGSQGHSTPPAVRPAGGRGPG